MVISAAKAIDYIHFGECWKKLKDDKFQSHPLKKCHRQHPESKNIFRKLGTKVSIKSIKRKLI